MKELDQNDEIEIKNLLIGKSIKKVSENELLLDDGTLLEIIPNEGCGGCSSGWYSITELNGCENVITNVEFNNDEINDNDEDFSYQIFVVAEGKNYKILQVDGSDGNGYYGTGYTIKVKGK